MKHFIIYRLGNKQTDIKFFKHLLPNTNDIEIICEAFAGSFSLIRNVYYDCKNIICADNDTKFTNQIKSIFNNFDEFNKEKEYVNNFITDKKYLKENGFFDKDKYGKLLLSQLKYLCHITITNRGVYKKLTTNIKYDDLKLLYDKITWYDDYSKVFTLLKDNDKAFVFCDPPYINSHNKCYKGINQLDTDRNIMDNTGMYIDIFEFMKICKCKVMLVINNNKLIHYIFKEFYKMNYLKTYSGSKNKEILNVYCNY